MKAHGIQVKKENTNIPQVLGQAHLLLCFNARNMASFDEVSRTYYWGSIYLLNGYFMSLLFLAM